MESSVLSEVDDTSILRTGLSTPLLLILSTGKCLARREPWRGIVGHPGPGVFIPRQIFRIYSG